MAEEINSTAPDVSSSASSVVVGQSTVKLSTGRFA